MAKYTWLATPINGVRFREHEERKHGVKKDRFYQLRYMSGGNRFEESLGWASQGWTLEKAMARLSEIKENIRLEQGPQSMKEKRDLHKAERQAEERANEAEDQRLARERLTFSDFFNKEYLPGVQGIRKPDSVRKSVEHVRNWLGPVLGEKPLLQIGIADLEKVRANMVVAGRSPRSMQYVFATFRAVWHKARDREYVTKASPTRKVDLPNVSNERKRYLNRAEASALLEALKAKSRQTYVVALFSLYTGMRFGEVVALTWGCIDMEKRRIQVLNAKGDKDRTLPMPGEVYSALAGMRKGLHNELVFKSSKGGLIYHVSKSFDIAVKELGLNENVSDPKQRFTFHCLRHTHASWLLETGASLYLVQRQLGHSTPTVTQRYGHLSDDQLEEATRNMERWIDETKEKGKVVPLHRAANS